MVFGGHVCINWVLQKKYWSKHLMLHKPSPVISHVLNQRPNSKTFYTLCSIITLAKTFGLLNLAPLSSHAFLSNHVMTLWFTSKLLSRTESCDGHFYSFLQTLSGSVMHHLNWLHLAGFELWDRRADAVQDQRMITNGSVLLLWSS